MLFELKIYRHDTGVVSQRFDSPSLSAAHQEAEAAGFAVLSSSTESTNHSLRAWRFPLNLFLTELVALLRAGLNITEAIDTLASRNTAGPALLITRHIRDALMAGRTLSDALAMQQVFPEMLIATVRASERSGSLKESLERYLAYQLHLQGARAKVLGALLYPALIITVGGLVLLFLLIVVVPRFAGIYEQMGGHLPAGTMLLVAWGRFVHAYGLESSLGFSVLLIVGIQLGRRFGWWGQLIHAFWQLPFLGEKLKIFELGRFYRTVGVLLANGMTVPAAIKLSLGILTQSGLTQGVAAAAVSIDEGHSLSEALEAQQLTDEVALRLIRAGERSGELANMLLNVADFYDAEIEKWISWATRLFEPLLMAAVGIIIGAVVLLMYLPIFQLADTLQ